MTLSKGTIGSKLAGVQQENWIGVPRNSESWNGEGYEPAPDWPLPKWVHALGFIAMVGCIAVATWGLM